MKTLNEVLYITEDANTGKWYVDFKRPQFQGGESEEISKEDAVKLMSVIKLKNPKIVKDFAHQEAIRIVDGKFNEQGLYKRKPIFSIDLFECEVGENKGGGVETTTIHKREDKIAYIENIINEII